MLFSLSTMLKTLLKISCLLAYAVATTNNDDNLRQALSEIAYRESQLTSAPYYMVPGKDQTESDDRLMYLDYVPSYKDASSFEDSRSYGNRKFRLADNLETTVNKEEGDRENEIENYHEQERYLKDRLLEKLLLDYLLSDEEAAEIRGPRQMKRSFFREREELTAPDGSLQVLYDDNDDAADDKNNAPSLLDEQQSQQPPNEELEIERSMPSLFRERIKSGYNDDKQQPLKKGSKSSFANGLVAADQVSSGWDEQQDYANALNSAWEKYQDAYLGGTANPEHLTDELIEDFIAYLNESKNKPTDGEYDVVSSGAEGDFINTVPFEQRLSSASRKQDSIDYLRKNPGVVDQLRPMAYSKRYWLGSEEKLPFNGYTVGNDNKEISIKKRSPPSAKQQINDDDDDDEKKNDSVEAVANVTKSTGKASVESHSERIINNNNNNKSIHVEIGKMWNGTVGELKLKKSDDKIHKKKWKEFKKNSVAGEKFSKERGAGKSKTTRKKDLSNDDESSTKNVPAEIGDKPLKIVKKSVDWSTYFGVDKRQQSATSSSGGGDKKLPNGASSSSNNYLKNNRNGMMDQYIQSYVRQSVRNSAFNHHRLGTPNKVGGAKRSIQPPSKMVDDDLKAAEDAIIDNVLKYTGAHEGVVDDPEEMERFKQTVLGQLGAAYNLEKLRKQLHQQQTAVSYGNNDVDGAFFYEKPKKVPMKTHREYHAADGQGNKQSTSTTATAIKKLKTNVASEKGTEFVTGNNRRANASIVNGAVGMISTGTGNNDIGIVPKQSQMLQSTAGGGQHHRGNSKKNSPPNFITNEIIEESDCPVLNDVVKKCHEIISLAGDRSNVFLPFCTIHQICYICGARNSEYEESCDVNFISQAVSFCGEAPLCQYTARRIMQTMYGPPFRKSFELDTCDSCLATSLQSLILQ